MQQTSRIFVTHLSYTLDPPEVLFSHTEQRALPSVLYMECWHSPNLYCPIMFYQNSMENPLFYATLLQGCHHPRLWGPTV